MKSIMGNVKALIIKGNSMVKLSSNVGYKLGDETMNLFKKPPKYG